MKTSPNTYAYLRVSTDQQDTENQLHGIKQYAEQRGLSISETSQDTTSGRYTWKERGIGRLIETGNKGDQILVSEISRLARSTIQVLEIMQAAAERGISIHVVKNGLIMDGTMQSRITATVLGLAAEIEREFIVARTTEALSRRKVLGLPMGRPPGEAKRLALDDIAPSLDNWRAKGLGIAAMAKLSSVSRTTIYTWVKRRRPTWLRNTAEKETGEV